MTAKKLWPLGLVIALLVLGSILPSLGGDANADGVATADQQTPEVVDGTSGADGSNSADAASGVAPPQFSNLPAITLDELPDEALDTLFLIDSGGPYPFDRDDLVFQNREQLLPDHPRGHYREYTVITPGENDRGARRVVAGDDGELYYTADHYSSFSEITAEP